MNGAIQIFVVRGCAYHAYLTLSLCRLPNDWEKMYKLTMLICSTTWGKQLCSGHGLFLTACKLLFSHFWKSKTANLDSWQPYGDLKIYWETLDIHILCKLERVGWLRETPIAWLWGLGCKTEEFIYDDQKYRCHPLSWWCHTLQNFLDTSI